MEKQKDNIEEDTKSKDLSVVADSLLRNTELLKEVLSKESFDDVIASLKKATKWIY